MKNEKFKDEILRYIDNLPVSQAFNEELAKNATLLSDIIQLSSDLALMDNIEDSILSDRLPKLNQKRLLVIEKIKNLENDLTNFAYEVRSAFDFKMLKMPVVRSSSSSIYQAKSIYLYKDIEVSIFEKKIYLKVRKIKNNLKIERNNKIINDISTRNDFEIELENGDYQITVDNYSVNIVIN